MKLQVFAVLLVVAGAYALPQSSDVVIAEPSFELDQRNIVEDQIRWFINLISNVIQRIGLDPIEVERRDLDVKFYLIDIRVKAFIENLKFVGLSNIRIHNLDYNLLFNRLRLDVSLPEISLAVGDAEIDASLLGRELEGQVSGSVVIKSIRLVAEVHVNVGLDGITLRNLAINLTLGGIESDVSLVLQGNDRSDVVNDFLNKRIPAFWEDNQNDINKVLEDIIEVILNRLWN